MSKIGAYVIENSCNHCGNIICQCHEISRNYSVLPTWAEYEGKVGYPVTEGEYRSYLKTNFKDQLEDNSEDWT